STANLEVGMLVNGAGISGNTLITAINTVTSTVTLSQPATATANLVALSFGGTPVVTTLGNISTTSNPTQITGLTTTNGLVAGMQVTGVGIPANTFVTLITSGTAVTLSQPVTATANSVTFTFTITPNTATTGMTHGNKTVDGLTSTVGI